MAVNSFNAQNPPLTTKGDLFTFSTIPTRLAVGANNTVLTADSSTSTGLKWATPAGAKNFSLLGTGTLSGAGTITVSGISGQDQIFVVIDEASSANASSYITLRINADNAGNYENYYAQLTYGSSNHQNAGVTGQSSVTLGMIGNNAAGTLSGVLFIHGSNTAGKKILQYTAMGGPYSTAEGYMGGGIWNNTATVSSISLISSTGNFDAGTYQVYGSA